MTHLKKIAHVKLYLRTFSSHASLLPRFTRREHGQRSLVSPSYEQSVLAEAGQEAASHLFDFRDLL